MENVEKLDSHEAWEIKMSMTFEQTKKYIRHDFYRNLECCSLKKICKAFFSKDSTIGLLLYFRLCHYLSGRPRRNPVQLIAHCYCYLRFQKIQKRCGIELNQHTQVGYGLRLPHRGGIIIHPQVVIGNNCEIMQGVTIGNNILKSRDGVAVIGDEVLLSAGAKIIGNVHIGNTVVVGANAVVTKDVMDHTIVAGIPAKEIKKCDDRFVINRYKGK